LDHAATIEHIRAALLGAGEILLRNASRPDRDIQRKSDGQPVTLADLEADDYLRQTLPREGEGWLSEETEDDLIRLEQDIVWIVDPLDGTKEFIHGIGDWSVSIGLCVDGEPVAGGIHNPTTGELVVGAVGTGIFLGAEAAAPSDREQLQDAVVVASRNELRRGEWQRFAAEPFTVRGVGSVAYKMSLVACGRADAMWTFLPKNEWDVAAGVALLRAGGGSVWRPDDEPLRFNRRNTRLPGIIATGRRLEQPVRQLLG